MHLALHRARADRAEAHQLRVVLPQGGIQEFRGCRQAQFGHVQQHLACQVQALVDMEAAIQVRVVDQAFPADNGARLFEVDAQHRVDGVGQRVRT